MVVDLDEGRLLRLALWLVRGISGRSIRKLADSYGSFGEAALHPKEGIAEAMGLGEAATRRLLGIPGGLLRFGEEAASACARRGGRLLFRGDPGYPSFGLLEDPPEVLFVRGCLAMEEGRAVAVVGAREADPSATELSRSLAHRLVREGRTVFSGGAFGVDAAAHRGALEAGTATGFTPTVAILGSGIFRPRPAGNRRLFSAILEWGGAIASELPPEEEARPEFFPRRNRLVAALSRAVVVVRAGETSGSLHTARAALRLGRGVYVFRTGKASNRGGEALVGEGAVLLPSEAALIPMLEGRREEPGGGAPAGERERLLLALQGIPRTIAQLAEGTGLPPGEVARIVASLCASGEVRPAGPGAFAAVSA